MNETKQDVIIDESNFDQYFRDCRNSKPERGDIIAKYSAIAELIAGPMKRDLIHMLKNFDRAVAATKVMKKVALATERDSVRICKEICQDLASGMSEEEINQKIYSYEIEIFYYTKKEYFPIDDPHWSSIGILNLDQHLSQDTSAGRIESKIHFPPAFEEKPLSEAT
jgi:hypothetical protein